MSFFEKMIDMFEEAGRARALSYLRLQSDLYLEDLGYSPKLVKQGLDAWPRREDDDVEHLTAQAVSPSQVINPVPATDFVESVATDDAIASNSDLVNSPRYEAA